ncbi:PAP2 family protein [Paludibacter sp. 221]|uniref:phosphatase PAP2 family protein n=1 Tax=Paludibacter sp. 221 TaxID=2302939 RepID=UPI0013D78CF9|nr:phosphatase PAP2 family protein [Paludibacter sp. 221]NDV47808.1 PAP2 family protein [Paludibacter sp. 221]
MNKQQTNIQESPREKSGGTWFWNIISYLFIPLLMPTYGMTFLFQLSDFSFLPSSFKWITIGGTILFTVVLPLIPILMLRRKGEISDVFISNREQRVMPYLFSFLSYAFWVYFLWQTLEMPLYVVGLGVGSVISLFIIVLINLKWKISAHMTGIGGFVGGVFGLCYRAGVNPVWFFVLIIFFSILLGLARIETKAHTPTQVLAGFIVGFLSVFLCCLFF